jgi:hypothetical protein
MTTLTFPVTSCNIRTDSAVPTPGAAPRMKQAAAEGGVVFGQEIDNKTFVKLWEAAMTPFGKATYGQSSENPVSIPVAGWKITGVRVELVTKGLTGVSPHRYVTVVHATHIATGAKISFVATHTVSKPRKGVDHSDYRISTWNEHHKHLAGLITAESALGFTVIWGGDLNRDAADIPKFVTGQKVLVESGYDHLYILPAKGWQLTSAVKHVIPRTAEMDHPIITATVTLTQVTAPTKPPVVVPPRPVAETSVQKLTRIAKSYVGYHEGRSGGTWNNDNQFAKKAGFANFQAWCATFIVAIFKEAGLSDLILTPSPGVDQLAAGFKHAGRWSEYPAIGAIMFRGTPGDLTHTGFVYAMDDTYAYTIEGNTNTNGSPQGDGVYSLKRVRHDDHLVGYGYPDYPEGIVSADPQFGKVAVKPPAAKPSGLVLDWSQQKITPAFVAKMKSLGVVGVMRYLSHNASKNLTHAEAKLLHDAGLWVGLVWETTATRASEGENAGRADAMEAEKMASAMGYPKGAVIFYAVDYDADPAKVRPYFHGVKAVAKRPVGIYGSYKVVSAGFADWRWQSTAWSHGLRDPKAVLFQLVGGRIGGTDENLFLRPFPAWAA